MYSCDHCKKSVGWLLSHFLLVFYAWRPIYLEINKLVLIAETFFVIIKVFFSWIIFFLLIIINGFRQKFSPTF
jgi:hypothetical protein